MLAQPSTTQHNRKNWKKLKVGGLTKKSIYLFFYRIFYITVLIIEHNVAQTEHNSAQLSKFVYFISGRLTSNRREQTMIMTKTEPTFSISRLFYKGSA